MRGGIYSGHINGDDDFLFRYRRIKLYTPRANNINNPPLLPLHDNEEYDASYFVEEDDNFPGYVKLSLVDGNCTNMNDDKLYLPNSAVVDISNVTKSMKASIPNYLDTFEDVCENGDINGPTYALYHKHRTRITTIYVVLCIQYTWPDSAKSFITRRKQNNWPFNSMLDNVQSQGCDVGPVGHHGSQNNDIL